LVLQPNISKNFFFLSRLADGDKSWRGSEVRLVKFRALNLTCILVSLACPISSDVFIHAKRSEESLVNEPCFFMEGHSNSYAPFCDAAGLPAAPAVALPTARPPIAPATTPPVLAVPVTYANSPRQSRHHNRVRNHSWECGFAFANYLGGLDTLAGSSSHHPRGQPPVRHCLAPLPSVSDCALLAQRTQENLNAVSALAAFQTAQILAAELINFPQQGFPKVPRWSHG